MQDVNQKILRYYRYDFSAEVFVEYLFHKLTTDSKVANNVVNVPTLAPFEANLALF